MTHTPYTHIVSTASQSNPPRGAPNKWLMAPIAFFFTTLSLMYLERPVAALLCFVITTAASAAGFMLMTPDQSTWVNGMLVLAVSLFGAVYAWRTVQHWNPAPTRPAYSRGGILIGLLIAYVASVLLLRSFVIEPFRTVSTAMNPGLPPGTQMLIHKWGYGYYSTYAFELARRPISQPMQRGVVYVFDYPVDTGKQFVKRLVDLPGDVVSYRDKVLSINGTPVPRTVLGSVNELGNGSDSSNILRQTRIQEVLDGHTYEVLVNDDRPSILGISREFAGKDQCQYDDQGVTCKIPADHYYFLGDNRDNSDDSRYWGFVPARMILGPVGAVFKPIQAEAAH